MSKEYNIDDILSEVKKRSSQRNEIKEELPIAEPEKETEPVAEEPPLTEEPEEEIVDFEEPEEASAEVEEAEEVLSVEEPEEVSAVEESAEETAEEDPNMVNLFEIAEEPIEEDNPDSKEESAGGKLKTKNKTAKILKAAIIVLVLLILTACVTGVVVAKNWLGILEKNRDDSNMVTSVEQWEGMKKLKEENFNDMIYETEATELSSLEDMLKMWYYNGKPVKSSHVLNILLIGEDTRGKEILEEDTRADAAIIASINIDTEEIILTSVLRDSWAYYEKVPGDESSGAFGKLNESMSTGDLNVYINTLERLYKIQIDNYAIVNFTSFEKIIDTLYTDGITLEMTSAEINEINSHPKRYGNVTIEKTFEGNTGKIKLNGKQALAYCRIRHIDSDGARADRQKTTLMTIYKDMRNSATKKLKFIKTLLPYVKTGFSDNEVMKIATYAISKGWTGYDIHTVNYPLVNVKGGMFNKEFRGQWVWRADFPADAYDLQSRIYGKTNITLAHKRVDTKKVKRQGFFKDGSPATTAYITNNAYGEATTFEPWEEEETEEKEEE